MFFLLPFPLVIMYYCCIIPVGSLSNKDNLIFFPCFKAQKSPGTQRKDNLGNTDTCFVLIIIQKEVDFEIRSKSVISNICSSS